MGSVMYWIAGLILSVSAVLTVWALFNKQKEGKGGVMDYFAIVFGVITIFAGAFLAFSMLGEFTGKDSTGVLGAFSDAVEAILKKIASEAGAQGTTR